MKRKANTPIELKASNVTIGFDLVHDIDLEFSRSNLEFALSQPKMVQLPQNQKQIYRLNSRVQMWLLGLTLAMNLTVLFSRSNVTLTFDHTGVRNYHIVIGVTSDVGVPPTRLFHVESQLLWFATDSQINQRKRMIWGCTIDIYMMKFLSGNSAIGQSTTIWVTWVSRPQCELWASYLLDSEREIFCCKRWFLLYKWFSVNTHWYSIGYIKRNNAGELIQINESIVLQIADYIAGVNE